MTRDRVLLSNVLAVAICALIYELLCGTLASYLLGNAVTQFSLVLGAYVFAMGVGAWLSKRFEARAKLRYVQAELLLAVVGGLSVPLLLLAVGHDLPLRPLLYATVLVIGALVGLELPLLVRILRDEHTEHASTFKDVIARALAYDYIGALVASLVFPVVLMPYFGLVRTAVLTGIVNAIVALFALHALALERPRPVRLASLIVLGVLAFAFVRADSWVRLATD